MAPQQDGADREAGRGFPAPVPGYLLATPTRKGDLPATGESPRPAPDGRPAARCWCLVGVLLCGLCISQGLLWLRAVGPGTGRGRGWWCSHGSQVSGSKHGLSSHQPNKEAVSKILEAIGFNLVSSQPQQLNRHKRDLSEAQYVSYIQYMDEMAALQTNIEQLSRHPISRLVLTEDYESIHPIDFVVQLIWSLVDGDLFEVKSRGRIIMVKTSGYYHLSLNIMFGGRNNIRSSDSISACSMKVQIHQKPRAGHPSAVTTLMLLSQTQENSGFRINGVYPLDTATGSGVFLLRHGDVIRVLPDNWSLGCRIHTDPIKTHMDTFLVKATDSPG